MTNIKFIKSEDLKTVLEDFMGESLKNTQVNVVTSAEINKELMDNNFKTTMEELRQSNSGGNKFKLK